MRAENTLVCHEDGDSPLKTQNDFVDAEGGHLSAQLVKLSWYCYWIGF